MSYVPVIQGECRVSANPETVFTTVLGSCIAVCLHDPKAKIGGMNHFLLPGKECDARSDNRFGVNAMELLINEMLKLGASRSRLAAKLYGGASLIKHSSNIGKSNADFAKSFLDNENIPVLGGDTGGTCSRRLKFQPATGRIKQSKFTDNSRLDEQQPTPVVPKVQADVTLF